ncbi:hypothetical protein DV702_01305 [Sporosarcina sp. PTS2304]|uniref:flagellin lysine-N-methylase n=1 Tax=Sporosarcina sp. PTS2304 TaxID=2283194 RepID=UPI000E0D7150|nr:flagellin lysine-N-methylase [Sporosarcina sp. PTS2304]AXH98462.1 hypothetical protein DV702_01305 [Sporosarcina sp. PTS2304]
MSGKNRDIIYPDYIAEFACIGSACEDTCCAGWFVSVDKATYKKYRNVKDPVMKKMLNENVKRHRSKETEEEYAKIKLDAEDKCTLLDEEHLCTIHKELGSEFLSNTCAMYPRLLNSVAGVVEKSATLSCPEAARLILLNPNGIQFTQDQESADTRGFVKKSQMTPHQQKIFWDVRIFIIQVVQYRKLSMEDRLIIVGLFLSRLEKLSIDEREQKLQSIITEFTEQMGDGSLSASIKQIPTNIPFQISLCKNLIEFRSSTTIKSDRYNECMNDMVSGFGMNSGISDTEVLKNYEVSLRDYYGPFMDKHEYILENYVVNHVFSKLFPFDKKSMMDSFLMLVINFALVKLHLIGMAKYHEGLTEELVIKLFQSIAKTIDHNNAYLHTVEKMIKQNGYETLAHMAVLVRS